MASLLDDPEDFEDALSFVESLATRSRDQPPISPWLSPELLWFRRVSRRITDETWDNCPAADSLLSLWNDAHRDDPESMPPRPVDPSRLKALDAGVSLIRVDDAGDGLRFTATPPDETPPQGSPLAWIRTKNRRIRVDHPFDVRRDFWAAGEAPEWASDWGIDNFGLWADFKIDAVTPQPSPLVVAQRMRWIPAGSFIMGSPETEAGRWDDEGPQHEATISEGFWLFDTPCTQALYEAVTGDNPSHFQTRTRPVEQVSWNDCQAFHDRLLARIPDLDCALPTEAEWEYACRAGTETATYAGDLEILGINNAPILHNIAWYGGNCGVDFDLDEGESTGWGKKQFEFEQGGSRMVAQKSPNPWGLYDMLGNVLEWCQDAWRVTYDGGPAVDPIEEGEASADRVVRGGSWVKLARRVRAAYRYSNSPGNRYYFLGFRCRVRSSEPSKAAAEQAWRMPEEGGSPERVRSGRRPQAEPGGDSGATNGVRPTDGDGMSTLETPNAASAAEAAHSDWINVLHGHSDRVAVPSGSSAVLVTDLEQVVIRQLTRPDWASAVGRDRWGLWAELRFPESGSDDSVERRQVPVRLRWIPPGWFAMGSPEEEPGRWFAGDPVPEGVGIASGFWILETPCTQAVWSAVMGDNPSEFRGPQRPVENVSWDRCHAFVSRVTEFFPALEFRLPRQAEWEYACRAGTTTATWAGDLAPAGGRGLSLPADIAWHVGNSQNQTHDVGRLACNPWGLSDMLGNVFEWCGDEPEDAGGYSSCAVRGGGYGTDVRSLRAGSMFQADRRSFDSDLGFRCTVRERSEPIVVQPNLPPGVDRPAWASGVGRDKYGYWAEFQVTPDDEPIITQKVRWIAPGRFTAGWPDTEPGFDADYDETPREAAVEQGFWLFDIPCTQRLWESVMGDNPSEFKGENRPVEMVSWEDCQQFFEKIPDRVPGLALSLPTDREWEYACRAGTETATYAGDLEIDEDGRAAVLDEIAWYDKTSDSETHDVAQLDPNA